LRGNVKDAVALYEKLTAFKKSVKVRIMMTAVDIYKLLPKTNCGTCGTTSCMGFAARLASHQASPDDCPTMTDSARETLREAVANRSDSPGTVYEQALRSLQPKIQALDFKKTAALFGAKLVSTDRLELMFLNELYHITKKRVTDAAGAEPPPFISILIYNHLTMPDPPPPAGEWITFSSIPASHAKDKAWAGHVEDVIAGHFAGNIDGLNTACEKLGGLPVDFSGSHDAAYGFRFFPRYPALLLFYDAAAKEDFPAQCKLLLDRTAPRYLDIESIVVLGEEFASRLTA
jgi:hypothetical protein